MMGKAVGIAICVIGLLIFFGPIIFAYGREWLAIRTGRERSVEHRDLDLFDWLYMIGWWSLPALGVIVTGVQIILKH